MSSSSAFEEGGLPGGALAEAENVGPLWVRSDLSEEALELDGSLLVASEASDPGPRWEISRSNLSCADATKSSRCLGTDLLGCLEAGDFVGVCKENSLGNTALGGDLRCFLLTLSETSIDPDGSSLLIPAS